MDSGEPVGCSRTRADPNTHLYNTSFTAYDKTSFSQLSYVVLASNLIRQNPAQANGRRDGIIGRDHLVFVHNAEAV